MKMSIRSKLIMAISGLMLVVFAIAANMFITEKKAELSEDIYEHSLAFARITADNVAFNYELYLNENSFVYFNREIKQLFQQNSDLERLRVISYAGELLYDSLRDVDSKFKGEHEFVIEDVLNRVRLEDLSVKVLDDGRLEYVVVPATERLSVLYDISYESLDARIALMTERIIYLAIFAVMLGMIMAFYMARRVSKPVESLAEAAERIAEGDFSVRVKIKSGDELEYLGGEFNKMAEDLGKSLEARVYKERVAAELELATKIQNQLIPDKLPEVKGLDLAAALIPAGEIGGDIYDFLSNGEDDLRFYLGDVTGHGVPAGIVSSIASSLMYGFSEERDIKKFLVGVNKVMKAKTMPNMFMTLVLLEWLADESKFNYVSAGHEQIVHYKANDGVVELMPAGGLALGMVPDIEKLLKIDEIKMGEGDVIVIYSDGIPECWQSEKESYGMDRLQKKLGEFAGLGSAEEIKEALLKDLREFAAGYEQKDDITIIVAKAK